MHFNSGKVECALLIVRAWDYAIAGVGRGAADRPLLALTRFVCPSGEGTWV